MTIDHLYVSNETFSIIQPIILTARAFGLFPVTYHKIANRYLLRWSRGYAAYSYVFIAVMAIHSLLGTYIDCTRDQKASLRMTTAKNKVVTCIDVFIIVTVAVFGSVTLRRKVKKFWSAIQHLNEADKIIPLTHPEPHRGRSIRLLSFVLPTTVAVFSFDLYVWGHFNGEHRHVDMYLRDYGTYYVLIHSIVIKELFFAHVVFTIQIRLEMLQASLVVMRRGAISGEKISAVMKYYSRIFRAAETVSSSMEYGVMILVLNSFLHLVESPYFLMNELLTTRRVVMIMLQLLWTLFHFGRLLMMVESCQRCSNLQRKLLDSACKLLCENSDRPSLKDEISALVHQMGAREIEFNACGFFRINRSLLTSVVASVATYLVILLQIK